MGANAHTRWWTEGPVGTIVLDNPPMNVLSDENRRGIREALAEFRDAGARAVVLTGAGERAFCGGAALKEEEELTAETVGKFLKAGDVFPPQSGAGREQGFQRRVALPQ